MLETIGDISRRFKTLSVGDTFNLKLPDDMDQRGAGWYRITGKTEKGISLEKITQEGQ